MDEQKATICRVCLSPKKLKYLSLFKKHKRFFIFEEINVLTNVQIEASDGLPDKICARCLSDLVTAVNFKRKCQNSNLILRKGLPPPKGEVGDLVDIIVKKEEPAELEQADDFFNYEPLHILTPADTKNNFEETEKKPILNEKLQCDDCQQYFRTKCKLRVHWKKVHLISRLVCPECKRKFKSFIAYNKHRKNQPKSCQSAKDFRIEGEGRNRVFFCKECEYKSMRIKDIMTHWVTHTGDRPFKCDLCPRTCTQQSSLIAHKESAHKEYKVELTCQYCGKIMKGRNQIYRHLKRHTEARVKCKVCKKTFKNKSCLSQHMPRHSGVKSYTCEQCASSFYTYAELSNHRRSQHSNIKMWYKCDLCEYKCARNERIKKHKAKHTDTNIACAVCGIFAENMQKLILHQRLHFEEKKYSCPFCDVKFFRRDTVPKHIKAKHAAPYHAHVATNEAQSQNINFYVKEEVLDNNFSIRNNVSESPICIKD